MICVIMNFKHSITKALKGQKYQYKATPCDWITETFQALKGQDDVSFLMMPFQSSNSRMCTFHRVLSDAIAKRFSALATFISCLFFIPKINCQLSILNCQLSIVNCQL